MLDSHRVYPDCKTIKMKTIVILTIAIVAALQNSYAQCYTPTNMPPVASQNCGCDNANGCDPIEQVTGYGSYWTCVGAASGQMTMTPGTPITYYSDALCADNMSWGNLALCLAACVGSGIAVPIECLTESGWDLGYGCWSTILTAGAGTISLCLFCAWNSCSANNSQNIPQPGYPETCNGGTCPLALNGHLHFNQRPIKDRPVNSMAASAL